MNRCVIHIGHAKTATTHLQHCLHLNGKLLAEAGYWLPADFSPFGSHNLTDLTEQDRTIMGNLGPMYVLMTEGPGDLKPAMFDFLLTPPAGMQHVLLSTEVLFYYPNALAEIVRQARSRGFTPELIGYVDRQDRAAITAYLQNVRYHGYNHGVVDFLVHDANMPYCRYAHAMRRIGEKSPGTQITLRSFNPDFLAGGDILADFLLTAGIALNPAAFRRPKTPSNEGLLLEQYELLRVAAILGWTEAAAWLQQAVTPLTPAERARTHAFYYRPHVKTFLETHYLPDNETLLATYMPRATQAERTWWTTLPEPTPPVALNADMIAELGNHAFSL